MRVVVSTVLWCGGKRERAIGFRGGMGGKILQNSMACTMLVCYERVVAEVVETTFPKRP